MQIKVEKSCLLVGVVTVYVSLKNPPQKVHPIKRHASDDLSFKAPKKKVSRSNLLQLCSETKTEAEKELSQAQNLTIKKEPPVVRKEPIKQPPRSPEVQPVVVKVRKKVLPTVGARYFALSNGQKPAK